MHVRVDPELREDAARAVELPDVGDGRARPPAGAVDVRVLVVQELDHRLGRRPGRSSGGRTPRRRLGGLPAVGRRGRGSSPALVHDNDVRLRLLLLLVGLVDVQHVLLHVAHLLDLLRDLEGVRVKQLAERVLLPPLPLPLPRAVAVVVALVLALPEDLLLLPVLEHALQGEVHVLLPLHELAQVAVLLLDELPEDLVERAAPNEVEDPDARLLADASQWYLAVLGHSTSSGQSFFW